MRLPPARSTNFIAAVTVISYGLVIVLGLEGVVDRIGGFIPARLSGLIDEPGALPVWLTPLSATLLHGGALHIAFNMLMLLYCGRMVEAVAGPFGIAVLYVAGAYAAAIAQYLIGPSEVVPMIGASGAVSALFGAYALLYSRPRLFAANPRLGALFNIAWLAVAWIGVQFLMGVAFSDLGMSIATAAHVGGFLIGLALIRPLMNVRRA